MIRIGDSLLVPIEDCRVFQSLGVRVEGGRVEGPALQRALGEGAGAQAREDPLRGESTSRIRAALRRVVARLARERLARPGAELSVEELVAAGWPAEPISPKAAADRVYAAVATLRQLGLGAALQSTGDGYRLDPDASWHTRG
ncbi:MAG: hypothetical protein R3B70_48675 [Polyangiaceae bacterium]